MVDTILASVVAATVASVVGILVPHLPYRLRLRHGDPRDFLRDVADIAYSRLPKEQRRRIEWLVSQYEDTLSKNMGDRLKEVLEESDNTADEASEGNG